MDFALTWILCVLGLKLCPHNARHVKKSEPSDRTGPHYQVVSELFDCFITISFSLTFILVNTEMLLLTFFRVKDKGGNLDWRSQTSFMTKIHVFFVCRNMKVRPNLMPVTIPTIIFGKEQISRMICGQILAPRPKAQSN